MTIPTYRTMMKGVFLDPQGNEQHFVWQSTEEPCKVATEADLRAVIEFGFTLRDCELLSVQMVVDHPTEVDVDELLGRGDASATSSVVPIRQHQHQQG